MGARDLLRRAVRAVVGPAPAKPLEAGQTVPLADAEDLRGTDLAGIEAQVGRASLQLAQLQQAHARAAARCREVMLAHGAELADPSKAYHLDTKAMTLSRTK